MVEGVLSLIGNTPLLELKRIFPKVGIRLFAKLEAWNPGGSAKDRPALRIIEHGLATNQYANWQNAESHCRGTMREILESLAGRLEYLFVAVSTCGTIRGCGQYLREIGHPAKVIAVDAVGSIIFGGARGKRLIPGLGAGHRTWALRSLAGGPLYLCDGL